MPNPVLSSLTLPVKDTSTGTVTNVTYDLPAGGGGSSSAELAAMNNILGAKNLLRNNATSAEINGITWTVNADGSIRAQGTASADSTINITTTNEIPVCNSYIVSGCPAGGAYETYLLGWAFHGIDYGSGCTVSYSETYHSQPVQITIRPAAGQIDLLFKPMIRPAAITDSTYEPYSRGNTDLTNESTLMLNQLGAKNLCPNNAYSQTINGVAFTVNADGSVVATRTSSNASQSLLTVCSDLDILLPDGDYILSGAPSGAGEGNFWLTMTNESENNWVTVASDGTERSFHQSSSNTGGRWKKLDVQIYSSYSPSNLTFYPMIRPASIRDKTYVPGTKSNNNILVKEIIMTAASGATSIAFTNDAITSRRTFDVYCDVFTPITGMSVSSNTLTVTFAALSSSRTFKLRIS